jgi:hypothetical protein
VSDYLATLPAAVAGKDWAISLRHFVDRAKWSLV